MDGLLKRIGFEFMINYHSAAELLLYGHGFQVQTESPDDAVYRALSGTDADPAIAGMAPGAPDPYDPDLSSELYTTNGETTEHAHSTLRDARLDTRDGHLRPGPRRLGRASSCSRTPRADLQDAFEKNVPFALDVAHSADDPANPESHLGRTTPNFEIHPFSTPTATPQPVEVNVKRELGDVTVHWKVNGGAEQSASTTGFDGRRALRQQPERLLPLRARGGHRRRARRRRLGLVRGRRQEVAEVHLHGRVRHRRSGARGRGGGLPRGARTAPRTRAPPGRSSPATTPTRWRRTGSTPTSTTSTRTTTRLPDQLGVLSHYDAVIWYTGNDLLTRRPGQGPGTGVARTVNDTIINVRDYLNEGGKLFYTGQYAAVSQAQAFVFNVEGEPPFCPPGGDAIAAACIPLSNDFLQYYLGAYAQVDAAGIPFEAPDPAAASALPMQFAGGAFGSSPVSLNGAGSANNQEHVYSMLETSSVLPETRVPAVRVGSGDPDQPPELVRPGDRLVLRDRRVRGRGLPAAAEDDRPDRGDRRFDCRSRSPTTPRRSSTT